MAITRAFLAAAVALVVLGVAACAQQPGAASPPSDDGASPSAALPADPAALVLRVEHIGGFTMPEGQAARLPFLSAYADGRVILPGPVAAIYPGFAWPNIQVLDIGPDGVRALAERALAAGVAESGDLGMPPIADAPSTRFTLTTAEGTHVREVYALTETAGMAPDPGLTEAQLAARQRLQDLFAEATDLAVAQAPEDVPASWTPAAVAAIAHPWTAPEGVPPGPAVPWPGPALPGEPLGRLPGYGCAVATGEQATAVIAAAADATVATPWTTPDGARWSVALRPLLPDESGCADLLD